MHILIVDDDALSAELAAMLLEEQGHSYALAGNGLEALAMIEANGDIELVISDLNMPLMSGLELFETLRDQGWSLPFVLLTGDDPAPLLAAQPGLAGALAKDAALLERLPALVERLAAAPPPEG